MFLHTLLLMMPPLPKTVGRGGHLAKPPYQIDGQPGSQGFYGTTTFTTSRHKKSSSHRYAHRRSAAGGNTESTRAQCAASLTTPIGCLARDPDFTVTMDPSVHRKPRQQTSTLIPATAMTGTICLTPVVPPDSYSGFFLITRFYRLHLAGDNVCSDSADGVNESTCLIHRREYRTAYNRHCAPLTAVPPFTGIPNRSASKSASR